MSTSTTYDKDALIRMTLELAQRAGAPVQPEDASKIPPMQMADDGRFEFDRTFGLMRKLTINRRIAVQGQDRLEGWTISLVDVPKR